MPLISGEGKLVGVLSQRDFLRFLAKNALGTSKIWTSHLKDLDIVTTLPRVCRSLFLIFREFVSAPESSLTKVAFKLMKSNSLSGLPVISADGNLVGSIHARDLSKIGLVFHLSLRLTTCSLQGNHGQFLKMLEYPLHHTLKMIPKDIASLNEESTLSEVYSSSTMILKKIGGNPTL